MVRELQNRSVATVAQEWPSSNSRRMCARDRTSGSGSLWYHSIRARRCAASRVMLRVMTTDSGCCTRGVLLNCTDPVYFPNCVELFSWGRAPPPHPSGMEAASPEVGVLADRFRLGIVPVAAVVAGRDAFLWSNHAREFRS